ncbi:MAG: MotA/TolQ/ExbB proton channel family protein [Pseudomonadota bacterium]|nr:MotA/TolQ/ExbB proton channel family protein [Pseudomonadales bacterium]MEC7765807.1 MotA/TolQ/ExbB proton channel family protein [Pseudomonadota bacterium]MED5386504.1 MotA/TolQ/ExbB proton channel family protein [Pseudomonadota bacterium]MED6332939.1 MotA/TolQ/ExbB proton channel family protein [Pseudomonadota bacterium]MEE3171754.1 MotA/TolQ/ExbB proton channel family protein [Pseudomonadota bacterium]
MKNLTKITSLALGVFLFTGSSQLFAQATSLGNLLDLVEQDRVAESEEYSERVQEFEQNANRQTEILDITNDRIIEQEQLQDQLSDQFEANEIIIADKREILRERRGDLNELFGTLQGVAGDFLSNFQNSLISAQYPGRTEQLEEIIERAGSTIEQLNISEMERFWFFMHQELTESGRVVTYNGEVSLPNGDTANRSITRVGAFNAVSDGEYLRYTGDIGHLQVLPRQPSPAYMNAAADLQSASSGFTRVGIDPTGGVGGQVLANLINFPTVEEQVRNNSGIIGFIIIGVGIVGISIAFLRLLMLSLVSIKVRAQLKRDKPTKNNPLGRVLLVAESNPTADTETLELKLGEAILQETPRLERMLTIIKMIATIAPLGGLLGTVTGMIQVFQQITVYGAGDPTIMAGGISQALMTTVLGITVAIPTIFMHTVVKSRADNIIHILEEQATGMIAEKAERLAAG